LQAGDTRFDSCTKEGLNVGKLKTAQVFPTNKCPFLFLNSDFFNHDIKQNLTITDKMQSLKSFTFVELNFFCKI